MPDSDAHGLLRASDLLVDEVAISQALDRLASEISVRLCDANPVVLTVMTGAVVFAGQLLPRLAFPLDLDYVHVTRYGDKTAGGALEWLATPRVALAGRRVLLVDDILDEGVTLAALRKWVLERGIRGQSHGVEQTHYCRFRRGDGAKSLCVWFRDGCERRLEESASGSGAGLRLIGGFRSRQKREPRRFPFFIATCGTPPE